MSDYDIRLDDPHYGSPEGTAKRGYLTGFTTQPTPIVYLDIDGQAILEGDIDLGTVEDMEALSTAIDKLEGFGRSNRRSLWPNGQIPYEGLDGLPQQANVKAAIQHWQENTLIEFVPKNSSHKNWVKFRSWNNRYGSSAVGMVGEEQFISLPVRASIGLIVHEIGHCVGLWHEHTRPDRDKYITIVPQNIIRRHLSQFSIRKEDGDTFGTPYDYDSVMHYTPWTFTKGSTTDPDDRTIIPLSPKDIGKQKLSKIDIETVKLLYNFPKTPPTEPPTEPPTKPPTEPPTEPPTQQTSQKVWSHGNSVITDDESNFEEYHRLGYGLVVIGKQNTERWFHAAVPMSLQAGRKIILSKIFISADTRFETTKILSITAYDLKARIATMDNVNLWGAIDQQVFELQNKPTVNNALGISIKVQFGEGSSVKREFAIFGLGGFLEYLSE